MSHLGPATNLRPSNPEGLESRGLPNPGFADDQFLPRPLEGPNPGFPDAPVHPHQVGVAEVVPGQAQNLPGPCTSEPQVRPQQKGLADDLGQSTLQQMSTSSSVTPAGGVF